MSKLIWLMGPPGSGKDSLLAEPRQQEPVQLLMAHRYIIRTASVGDENCITLGERESFTHAGQNLLALGWYANDFYYGVGVEIDLWLYVGFDAVVNGSRVHPSQVQAHYDISLLPICLQVSPAILRQRLRTRGQGSGAEITACLERAARYTPYDCHVLNDDGSLLRSVGTLLTLIGYEEKKHARL